MTDTRDQTEVEEDFSAAIPGYKFTLNESEINGLKQKLGAVNFGTRTLEVAPLNMAEQWDLLEIVPAGKEDSTWFNVASVTASVKLIDGVAYPALSGMRDVKSELRRRILKLGNDGIRAAMAGLADMAKLEAAPGADNAAVLATAKN